VLLGVVGVTGVSSPTQSAEFKPKAEGPVTAPAKPHAEPPSVNQADPQVTLENVASGSELSSGHALTGRVVAPDGVLSYRLKGVQSGHITAGLVQLSPSPTAQPFSTALSFEKPIFSGERATLELSSGEAKSITEVTVR